MTLIKVKAEEQICVPVPANGIKDASGKEVEKITKSFQPGEEFEMDEADFNAATEKSDERTGFRPFKITKVIDTQPELL